MNEGRWVTLSDGRRVFIKNTNEYMNEKIRRGSKKHKQEYENTDYMMTHRPSKTGITADNLINQNVESPMPKDVYDHPEYYSVIGKQYTNETMFQLNKVRGNPNGEVVIYRATTGDKINNGDWITLSKSYAEHHNESQLDGKGRVVEMRVKASDVQFAGDDLAEWGYFPKSVKKQRS